MIFFKSKSGHHTSSRKFIDCAANAGEDLDKSDKVLKNVISALKNSPQFKSLHKTVMKNWDFELSQLESDNFYELEDYRIILNQSYFSESVLKSDNYFRFEALEGLTKACRDAWHETQLADAPTQWSPEGLLRIERARSADIEVFTLLVLWEMSLETQTESFGDAPLWRYVLAQNTADMARIFVSSYEARQLVCADKALNAALADAYIQWYRDHSRVCECDHKTLTLLDSFLEERVFGEDIFGRETPDARTMMQLGCLNYTGKTYLASLGRQVASDPLFCGMQDLVNQTHLMQIVEDAQSCRVCEIPFRSPDLARRLFPETFELIDALS